MPEAPQTWAVVAFFVVVIGGLALMIAPRIVGFLAGRIWRMIWALLSRSDEFALRLASAWANVVRNFGPRGAVLPNVTVRSTSRRQERLGDGG